jgi:sterol 3beta-glucosyltransferase
MYRDLEYATTLTRQRAAVSSAPYTPTGGDEQQGLDGETEEIDEAWTFVDDDTDFEQFKRGQDLPQS